jgi:hypothetical protein
MEALAAATKVEPNTFCPLLDPNGTASAIDSRTNSEAMSWTSTCQEFYYEKFLMSFSTIPIPDYAQGKRLHGRPEDC